MKLYTIDQVDIMLSRARMQKQDDTYMFTNEYLLSQETPIELPSDEEIEKEASWLINYDINISFKEGAKWMKKQILNQNNNNERTTTDNDRVY